MSTDTVTCPKCGHENDEQRIACATCGALLHLMQCPGCGATNSVRRESCFQCGAQLHAERLLAEPVAGVPATAAAAIQQADRGPLDESYVIAQLGNASGHGPRFSAPPQARGWNWGAFWLTWVWGMANNVWASLAVFLPGGILVVPFILGARGSEWAWQNRRYEHGVSQFSAVQRRWAAWGWAVGLVQIVALIWLAAVVPPKVTAAYNGYAKRLRDVRQQIDKTTKQLLPEGTAGIEKQLQELLNDRITGE